MQFDAAIPILEEAAVLAQKTPERLKQVLVSRDERGTRRWECVCGGWGCGVVVVGGAGNASGVILYASQ